MQTSPIPALRSTRRFYSRLLMAWSVASIVLGLPAWLLLKEHPFLGPFFVQCWIWGAIDIVFALLGLRQAAAADRTPITPDSAAAELADANKLLGALAFSHKLNYLWLATAAALYVWSLLTLSPYLAGHATGVLIQGGYLFVQDRKFDTAVRRSLASTT